MQKYNVTIQRLSDNAYSEYKGVTTRFLTEFFSKANIKLNENIKESKIQGKRGFNKVNKNQKNDE